MKQKASSLLSSGARVTTTERKANNTPSSTFELINRLSALVKRTAILIGSTAAMTGFLHEYLLSASTTRAVIRASSEIVGKVTAALFNQ